MKLYYETTFEEFAYKKCWAGACDTIKELTENEMEILGNCIEDMIDSDPDDWDEVDLNDFLWFEDDTIAEWLGYKDFEDLIEKHRAKEKKESEEKKAEKD